MAENLNNNYKSIDHNKSVGRVKKKIERANRNYNVFLANNAASDGSHDKTKSELSLDEFDKVGKSLKSRIISFSVALRNYLTNNNLDATYGESTPPGTST
jgi:hypothetical protein